jgi:hypothetical protein
VTQPPRYVTPLRGGFVTVQDSDAPPFCVMYLYETRTYHSYFFVFIGVAGFLLQCTVHAVINISCILGVSDIQIAIYSLLFTEN